MGRFRVQNSNHLESQAFVFQDAEPKILRMRMLRDPAWVQGFIEFVQFSDLDWYWFSDEARLVYYYFDHQEMPDKSEWRGWPGNTNGNFEKINELSCAEFGAQCSWRDSVWREHGLAKDIIVCALEAIPSRKRIDYRDTLEHLVQFREGPELNVRALLVQNFASDCSELWIPQSNEDFISSACSLGGLRGISDARRLEYSDRLESITDFERWLEFTRDDSVEDIRASVGRPGWTPDPS